MFDHLVYATNELAATVDELEVHLGVRPTPGGRHPTLGTRNHLAALGHDAYLEVIGPDEGPPPAGGRPYGIDDLPGPRLVAWAARSTDLTAVAERLSQAGYETGPIVTMTRRDPAGSLLCWELTHRDHDGEGGVMPFFIDWGVSAHPATVAANGLTLECFRAAHPDPARILANLAVAGERLDVVCARRPSLQAVIRGPVGRVVLR